MKITASLPDRIVIVIDTAGDVTLSGLHLGGEDSQRQCAASVIGVHPEDPAFSVGDAVIVNRDCGVKIDELNLKEGHELRVVKLQDVFCKFDLGADPTSS